MAALRQSLVQFARSTTGGITLFFVILAPLVILLGGIGVEYNAMNARKRMLQAQADLAALSAATLLPDRTAARNRVHEMLAANAGCATGSAAAGCTAKDLPEIIFLRPNATGALVPSPTADQPASAVQVRARLPYDPLMLGALLSGEDLQMQRPATAQKVAEAGASGIFTLRNQLLRLNVGEDTLLGAVLNPLGLELTADVLGSGGLAAARVHLDDLLWLASGGVGLELLSFNDVLNLQVPIEEVLGLVLRGQDNSGIRGVHRLDGVTPPGTVSMGEILKMSPRLVGLKLGDMLPDIELGALDILGVLAGLAGGAESRISLNAELDLLHSALGGAKISLGLIRSHVTAMTAPMDLPLPQAVLKQTDLALTVGLLSIIRLDLLLGIAGGEVSLTELNCSARAGSNDLLAAFEVETFPLSATLALQLLNKDASLDASIPAGLEQARLLADRKKHRVEFTRAEYDAGSLTKSVKGDLKIASLGAELNKLLGNIRIGNSSSSDTPLKDCGWRIGLCIIQGIVDGLVGAVAALVGGIATLLATVIPLDLVVNKLLEVLGIRVAELDLTLNQVNCLYENAGPAVLVN